MVAGGAVLFGLSYGATALLGLTADLISSAFGHDDHVGDVLLIPIVGPFAMMGVMGEFNGGLMFDGLAQVGGVALMAAGWTPSKVLVKNSVTIRTAAPLPVAAGGGLVLGGTF